MRIKSYVGRVTQQSYSYSLAGAVCTPTNFTFPLSIYNAEFTNVSFHFPSYVQHTLYMSCRILPFSLPTGNHFLKFVYSEIMYSLPGGSSLGPLGVVGYSGN